METESVNNPANISPARVTDATRIPMAIPRQQLEVPPIPGYYLYWFVDRPGRINRALQGGYEFVNPSEVDLNNRGLADDALKTGNSDMGSRVSIFAGVGENGTAERLYLMKIKSEWHEKDNKIVEDRNDMVAASLRGGRIAAEKDTPGDAALRYGGQRGNTNLFTKKRRT